MIAFLSGKFAYKSPTVVHLDVNGVGYELQVSLHTFSKIQHLDQGTLLTYYQVREDGHTIYGFYELIEKSLFILLISVSGVGASTARMMLSSMKPEEIAKAIMGGQFRLLETIKGIGKKSAERIVLELKDKVGKIIPQTNISSLIDNTLEQDALNALIALGIGRQVAENALQKVLAEGTGIDGLEDIIKKVLKAL